MQRAYAKLPGLFVFFLKQPFKKPKLMKSKSGKRSNFNDTLQVSLVCGNESLP